LENGQTETIQSCEPGEYCTPTGCVNTPDVGFDSTPDRGDDFALDALDDVVDDAIDDAAEDAAGDSADGGSEVLDSTGDENEVDGVTDGD